MKIVISKQILKERGLASLPSFDIESLTDGQQQVIVDVLLNEYHRTGNCKEEGENATE